jgi:signal transduction histidine kinase
MILRQRLIVLAATAVVLMLVVLAAVQMHEGQLFIVETAAERVALHIDTAWTVLGMRQQGLEVVTDLLASRPGDADTLRRRLDLDVLAVMRPGESPAGTVAGAVARRYGGTVETVLSGYVALESTDLAAERPVLRERTLIDGEPAATMALFALRRGSDGSLLVAAQVLTRSDELLWRIQRGLFGDGFYGGRRTGTVTIFTGTRRTSTTVVREDGSSAVGTHVSDEVARRVLDEQESWTGPATVVGVRYVSRYDPIREPGGRVIGMLYVGELEDRLLDRKYRTVLLGVGSIAAILLLAGLVGVILLRLEKRAAAQRHRVRFEFLRVLGHELKAPINAVEGYLRLLEEQTLGPLPEGYRRMVDRSVQRIVQMRELIAALLDLTRIEAGEKRREIVDGVDLVAVLRESVETVEPEAAARGITITVEAPAGLPMRADRGELSIVGNNLLTNAVKYNRDGGAVTVRVARDRGRVTLAVSDTGIGMTPDETARLFGEFVRIRNDRTSHVLGSGLGLNILRKIVALYGGEVTVASEPDVGSTFTVTLADGA